MDESQLIAENTRIINAYAADVLSGREVACQKLVKACKRHFDDLEREGAPFYFDEREAWNICDFAEMMEHTKGRWKTPTIKLERWQRFYFGSLFGWRRFNDEGSPRRTNPRRFRYVYSQIARKNAKSTMAAIIGLYCLLLEDEVGAEIYSAATKRDQARIVFDAAKAMVSKNKFLSNKLDIFKNNISDLKTLSKFEPLSSDSKTLDGLNVHCAIADEMHAYKDSKVWNVLETATGARENPLMLGITTAGYERAIALSLYHYSEKVLDEIIEDDGFFVFITEMDEGDDWTDPTTWKKANPNLGVSVFEKQLSAVCKKAQEIPTEQNDFLCKHLNVWVNQSVAWIPYDAWKQCRGEYNEAALEGRECFGGLDLSSTQDITAFVLVFPPIEEGEPYKFVYRFWVPQNNIEKRSRGMSVDKMPYDAWLRDGYIKTTEGSQIDYNYIEKEIKELSERFKINSIAFDPFKATQTVQNLMAEGFDMALFSQTAKYFHDPMDHFIGLLLDKKINHGDHPAMNWMASNMLARHDVNMNMAPDKKNAKDKIDGVVALLMGLGLYLRHVADQKKSIYEETEGEYIF